MTDEELKEFGLTKKQEMFCRHYVKNGFSGLKAAISAGYSEKSAKFIGAENLTKLNIAAFIKKLQEPELKKLEINENWVLGKLKSYSNARITDYFEIKKGKGLVLREFNTLTEEQLDAIESIKETKNGYEIKLVNKKASVVDIGRHLGMWKDTVEGNVNHNHVHKVYVVPSFDGNMDDVPVEGEEGKA